MKRIPELDGIRGVAIGLVLLWHFVFAPIEAAPHTFWAYFQAAGRLTWSGVDLFFVLSGFLIGGILLDSRDSPNYFRTFYIRRFFRIVPLYVVVLLVGLALGHGSIDQRIPALSYFAFLQNFWMARYATMGVLLAATWSLAIEEQFYLTLPAVLRFAGLRWIVAGIIAAPVSRMALAHIWPAHVLGAYVLMPCRADSLLLGVLGAYGFRSGAYKQHKNALWIAAAVLLVGAGILTLRCHSFVDPLMVSIGYTWLSLLYLSVILLAVTQPASWLGVVLRWQWLRWLGSIAYGVYLLHQIAAIAIFRILWHSSYLYLRTPANAGALAIALAATLAVCTLSWRYFEKPLVQLSHCLTAPQSPCSPIR